MNAEQRLQLALRQHRAGQLPQAEALYRQILAEEPNHPDALHFLGAIACQVGRSDLALDLVRQAVALQPVYRAEAFRTLGHALMGTRQPDQAIAAYRQAIDIHPTIAENHGNLGNALFAAGQIDEAIGSYRQAIVLNPNFAEAHGNLGNALSQAGRLDEALTAFRQAIDVRPAFPEAHFNLGNLLGARGCPDDAIAAYRQAVAIRFDFPEAHCNLGNALTETGRVDDALAAFRQAIALRPNYADAINNLGNALSDMGLLDEGIAAFRQILAIDPSFRRGHSSLVYALLFHPDFGAVDLGEERERWHRQFAEPLAQSIRPHSNERPPDRPLRIGYVSTAFRDHVVGRNLLPLFRHHDREQFSVHCYSQVMRPDAVTRQFQEQADVWRNISGLSDEQVAQQVLDDRIDILVDLTLHMAGDRLLVFARKPAPVQVTFAGYPGSTGLRTIDYRLSDSYLDPPGAEESIDAERTVRLPDSFWCYDPLDCRDIPVSPLPSLAAGVVTFGCLNNLRKVNSAVLRLWARLLRATSASRLLLLTSEGSHRGNVLDLFEQEGIALERIEFVSRQTRRQYLESYHRIDLGLDTVPYNGHTTSLDSLWMGVPMVTLVGRTVVGRAGLCQLRNLNNPELIAETPEQYLEIAVSLTRDRERCKTIAPR